MKLFGAAYLKAFFTQVIYPYFELYGIRCKQQTKEGKKVKIQNKLLFVISIFSILIVIYQLWSTIPNLGEYASNAYLFQDPQEGYVWSEWVLEAREMLWESSIGLILNVCFFISIAFWSFSGAIGKRAETPAKPETTNET